MFTYQLKKRMVYSKTQILELCMWESNTYAAIITRRRGDIIKYINQIYMQSAMSVLHTLYLSKAQLPDLLDCVVFWPWACLGLSGKNNFGIQINTWSIQLHISQLYGFPVEFEMDTDTTNTIYLHSSSWPSSLSSDLCTLITQNFSIWSVKT